MEMEGLHLVYIVFLLELYVYNIKSTDTWELLPKTHTHTHTHTFVPLDPLVNYLAWVLPEVCLPLPSSSSSQGHRRIVNLYSHSLPSTPEESSVGRCWEGTPEILTCAALRGSQQPAATVETEQRIWGRADLAYCVKYTTESEDLVPKKCKISYSYFLKKLIWEREKEGERQRDIWFVAPLIYALIGWFLYVPWLGLNPQPWCIGWRLCPTQLPSQGIIHSNFLI